MSRARLVVLCSLVPAVAHAQLGSLGKKIKDKVAGPPSPSSSSAAASAPAPADCLKCVAKNMAITPDLVNRLIVALKAELAERNKEERLHAQDGVGRLYVARDFARHCDTLKRADSAETAGLAEKMRADELKGDYQAAMKVQQDFTGRITDDEHKRCANQKAPQETDQPFFNMLNAVQARQDSVGAKAGGFTPIEFAAALELVSYYALDIEPGTFPTRYPPSAMQAMEPHRAELESLVSQEFHAGGSHKLSYEL